MKRKKLKPLGILKSHAWRVFSRYVRSSVSNFQGYSPCYTCGKMELWQDMNAGHYRHDSHDFDDKNVKCQCVSCNLADKGRADEFYIHLVKDYGVEVADELRKRVKWNDYSRQELESIILKYSSDPHS